MSRAREIVDWKTCTCGAVYTRAEWTILPLIESITDDARLERRNCGACRSARVDPDRPRDVRGRVDRSRSARVGRRVGMSGDEVAAGIGTNLIIAHGSAREVERAIKVQRAKDRAAATRLGVILD